METGVFARARGQSLKRIFLVHSLSHTLHWSYPCLRIAFCCQQSWLTVLICSLFPLVVASRLSSTCCLMSPYTSHKSSLGAKQALPFPILAVMYKPSRRRGAGGYPILSTKQRLHPHTTKNRGFNRKTAVFVSYRTCFKTTL